MKKIILAAAASIGFAACYHFAAQASPLDDAYIYFQYARSAAQGLFFIYQPGDAASTGVSGLLYYGLLSFAARLGMEGPPLAWAIGSACFFTSLVAWLILAERHFKNLGTFLSLALFVLLAPLSAAFFNGLETGLFFACLFWSLEALGKPEIPYRIWPLLMLLAFSRPEGQIAAFIFCLWSMKRQHRISAPALFVLAACALPSLVIWLVSGSLIPDSVRPKTALLLNSPFPYHLKVAVSFAWDSLSGLFLNLRGMNVQVGSAGSASAGNPPYVHYLPLSLLFALAGYWFSGRWWPLLFWATLSWLLLAWNLPAGWHQHRYLTALAPAMLLGFASFLNEIRPSFRLALALAWCLFGAAGVIWFHNRQLDSALLYQEHHGNAAAWLKAHAAPGTRVAVVDAGILAYQSGLPIVDLLGITDHRLALAAPHGDRAVIMELMSRPASQRPSLAALHWERPDFNPQRWVQVGLLKELVTFSPVQGPGGHLGIFAFDWTRADVALK
jgi:hypothetical protein